MAEHLLLYYLHGDIERMKDGPVSAFFERAPVELRAHALGFGARALARLQDEGWEKGWERLRALWEWRFTEVLQGTGGSLVLEVSEFGWWFIERRIPRDWALAQLREVLQAGVVAEPSHKVMEAMALDAADSLEQVMDCLELFLKTAQTPWAIRSWRKEIREIIGLARVEETAPMRQKAVNS